MRVVWLWLAPALAAAGLAQPASDVVREGREWTRTSSGAGPLAGADQLRVATRGAISVRGEARNDLAYMLKARARARNDAEARELLRQVAIKLRQQGGWTVMEVDFPRRSAASSDLQLRVPRKLRDLVLESRGSSVEAYDLDGSVRADSGGGRIQMDRIQGDVNILTAGGDVRLGKMGRSLKCSSGGGRIAVDSIEGKAELNTGGGDIFVREAGGAVRAWTGGGNIQVERADMGVTASTGGGLIEVMQANGPVVAEAGSGSIKVRAAGDVQCRAGAGAIQLLAVYGGLRISTGMGSIMAELLAGKPLHDSTLTTGMGDITVYIPSNLAVTVQAVNASPGGQRIVSDFSEIRPRFEQGYFRSEAQGALNGGGPVLRLTAAGGTIYLRRQK